MERINAANSLSVFCCLTFCVRNFTRHRFKNALSGTKEGAWMKAKDSIQGAASAFVNRNLWTRHRSLRNVVTRRSDVTTEVMRVVFMRVADCDLFLQRQAAESLAAFQADGLSKRRTRPT